jgi:carbon-monoxide dehydrogenase medium subunit
MSDAHPGLPEFDYLKPESLADASQFMVEHAGEARVLLGGTDMFVRIRDGVWKEKYVVDVKGLEGMNDISFDPSSGLTVGAAVSMNRVSAFPAVKEHYDVLAQAVDSVASYQLRTRATIVGNICNASPAGDTIGACLLLDGVLNVHGVDGVRQEPLSSFFVGPGDTVLDLGDIVTSIRLPEPSEDLVGVYMKHGRNKASDLSIVGVTAIGYPDTSLSSGHRIRLALASVAPTPLVVDEVETIFSEKPMNEETIEEAARAAMEAAKPIDDVRSSARYRKMMTRNLSRRALLEIHAKLGAK